MLQQYKAWLQPGGLMCDEDRRRFFTEALVVLDTNVLLSLYEYTPPARAQVLAALERVKERLWLPYQVGLEFVRGRHRVIASRTSTLRSAPDDVNRKLNEARKALLGASALVKDLLAKYAQDDDAIRELDSQINQDAVEERFTDWKETLLKQVAKLKNEHDVALASVASNDPVLPCVAELYGDRIGKQPAQEVLRQRVKEAAEYRFPNNIPPGFSDRGKATPLQAAGDFLLWEELVEEAKSSDSLARVLFISADVTKGDWYEPEESGRGPRPWPMLYDELRLRSGAELCIETPGHFFQGVRQYLDAEITETTYEEIDRAAERPVSFTQDYADPVTEESAGLLEPPPGLALAAYRAAGLTTAPVRAALESPERAQWMFQWWLIGVTAQLGRREPVDGEPEIELQAATRSSIRPAPHWQPGQLLRLGEWPYRSTSWIAPWFVQLLNRTAQADRMLLQRLAAHQADLEHPE